MEEPSAALATEHARLVQGVADLVRHARARRTWELYARDWKAFESWCAARRFVSLPAEPGVVAMYLNALYEAKRAPSTIDLALATICARHRSAGLPNPRDAEIVRETRAGIRRDRGAAPRRVSPLLVDELRLAVRKLDPLEMRDVRDRVVLLLGWAAALRESELVALDAADVEIGRERMIVTLRRSKTDQEGAGAIVGVRAADDPELCPLAAVRRWVEVAQIRSGPLMRRVWKGGAVGDRRLNVRAIDAIVKRAAEAAGLDAREYAGHSLRAGLATSAADAGKSLDAIMRQTRHRSVEVARTYVRRADAFHENVLDGLI